MIEVETKQLTVAKCGICISKYESLNAKQARKQAEKCKALGPPEKVPFGTVFEGIPTNSEEKGIAYKVVIPENFEPPCGYRTEEEKPAPKKVLRDQDYPRHMEWLDFADIRREEGKIMPGIYRKSFGHISKDGESLKNEGNVWGLN